MYKVIQNTSGGIATQIGTVRSGDDGETEYALVEIGFDSEGVAYANVPSTPNDANNNRAATSKFVNDRISAHDATLVHTTGSETISGSKTFESPVVSKAVSLIQSTNWSGIRLNDTSRTSDSTKMLAQILDADGKRWIGLETTASTDGSRTVQLIGRNRDDTAWLNFIKFWERADGTYNVYLARNPVTSSHFLRSKSLPNSVSSEVRSPCAWHKGCSSSCAIKSPWLMENRDSSRHCRHNLKNSHSMRP